jgi:hypothetical protein
MHTEQWLLLTDYASKYRISVSTLRRRIKGGQIPFRFDNGKYYIQDTPPAGHYEPETTSSGREPEMPIAPGIQPVAAQAAPLSDEAELKLRELDSRTDTRAPNEEPILSSATKLLNELKRAYMNVLQEKEEQIIQLKEEVTDLKTLVRVLEDENDRLRRFLSHHPNPS